MRLLVGLPLLKEHNMAGLGKSPKCYTEKTLLPG